MGLMYDGDMFFRKDIKKAQDFFLKGCDSDDKLGCSILGDKYSNRKVKSIKFYTKACLLKDRRSCEKLIKIYFKEGNKIKENLFHRKACMLGTQKSCRKINY